MFTSLRLGERSRPTLRRRARRPTAMPKPDFHERYTRLSRALGSGASLWRGRDHLVSVRGRGFILPYAEEYRRFRFSEIQGFALVKRSRLGMAALYGGGLMLCGIAVVAWLAIGAQGWNALLAVATSAFALGALLFAGLLARHLVLGPLCRCEIVTDSTQEPLFALTRYHAARQVLEALVPEVREAQAQLAAGEGVAANRSTAAIDEPGRHSSRSPYSVPTLLPWTFGGAAGFGLLCLATLFLESVALVVTVFFLLFAFSFLLLSSLVYSVRKPVPHSLRHCLWSILGALFLFIGVAMVYLPLAMVRDDAYSSGIEGPFEAFTAIGGGPFFFLFLATSLAFVALGTVGLALGSIWRQRLGPTPSSAAEVPAPWQAPEAQDASTAPEPPQSSGEPPR